MDAEARALMQIIWDFLTSRDLAIVLLVAVTVMLAVGAFLPNPDLLSDTDWIEIRLKHPVISWLGERYNSQEMARGYVFGFVGIFLVISTVLCSVNRLIKTQRRRGEEISIPTQVMNGGIRRTFTASDIQHITTVAGRWLKSRRWKVSSQGHNDERIIIGSRGKAGFWGSIIFHFILITALGGLLYYHFGGYRASFSFTEGQSYRLAPDSPVHILREPVWGLRLPEAELGLVKQYSLYSGSDPWNAVEHVAIFRIKDLGAEKEWKREVRINDPLVIEGKKFLLTAGGFSPKIVIENKTGRDLLNSFVALKDKGGTRDTFELTSGELVEAQIFPEFYMEGEEPATRSMQAKNPFLRIRIDRRGTYIYDEMIPINNMEQTGEFKVFFPELRRWVEMELVGEPGIGFFFIVSFLGLFTLLVRVFDPDERIFMHLKSTSEGVDMHVYPYSKHFSGLIEDNCVKLAAHVEKGCREGDVKA